METDGHPAAVADEAEQMAAIARGERRARCAARRATRPRPCALAAARRNAFSALARRRPTTILEDFTVPRSELATMVNFIAETAARSANLQIGTFGHMGDGNLHPTFLTDERDATRWQRVHHALDAIAKKTLELGGTITGEHGVGLAKKAWLRQQMGDGSFEVMRQMKQALDPPASSIPGRFSTSEADDARVMEADLQLRPRLIAQCDHVATLKSSTTRSCSSACTAACACRRARPTTRRSASGTARAAGSR